MAFVALTSLMETIRLEFLQSGPRVSLDAENLSDLQAFLRQLSHFQAFLQKPTGASAKTIKYLNTKIRDFALKSEDHIETQLHTLLLANDHHAEKASLALHQALREPTQNAVQLLNIITTTISSEADDTIKTQPPSLLKQAAASGRSENVQSSEKGRSWWRSPEKFCMIDRRRDCDVIKDRLLRGSSELGLIPIVGMVGIGKTTLVKTIYTDPALLSHFQVRGGVTMRPEFDKKQMLSDLLQSINGAESNETKEGITTTTSDLANQLRKCLNGKRYVIVLDNLLNHLAWDDIHRYFPNDGNGSCILLTTRHFDGYYARGSADHIHYMTLLDPKESWDLFCHILPHNKKSMMSKFEKIRKAFVEKCEGLAQAIVTVTKCLSECNNIEQEWKKIEKELRVVRDSRSQ